MDLNGSGTYTFRKGQGCTIVCTGNLPKDGVATHMISDSFDRRVPKFDIPNLSPEDWQDFTVKILTSLPVAMLHQLTPGTWKDNSGEKEWVLNDPAAFY